MINPEKDKLQEQELLEDPSTVVGLAPVGAASSEAESDAALIGTTIGGHYEVLSCLGRGGMSVVYKVHHKLLNRIMAIKIILPERKFDANSIFAKRRSTTGFSKMRAAT